MTNGNVCHRGCFIGLSVVWTCLWSLWPVQSGYCQAPTAASTTSEKEQFEKLITQARQSSQAGKWDAVIALCNQALVVEPTSTAAFLERGIAKDAKGEFDEALKDLDLALAQGARDPASVICRANSFYQKAKMYYRRGEFLKTLDNGYFAILEKYDHVDAHCIRGLAYLERQQFDKAIYSADRALQTDANCALAFSIRGVAYASKKNIDQALTDHNKAANLASQDPAVLQRRAAALLAKGDFKAAAQDIDAALKLQPSFVDALCDRAYLFTLLKDQRSAIDDLEAAIKIDPKSARAHYLLGSFHLNAEKYSQAITCFDKAVDCKAGNALAYCSRAYAHQGLGKHAPAIEDFTKAIELDDKLVEAYQGRGNSYLKLKKVEESRADLAMARKLSPEPEKGSDKKKDKKAEKKKSDKASEDEPKFKYNNKPVSPAKLAHAREAATKIDSLVAANYKKFGVKPNPKTSDEQFVRRVYLDITGTIPTYPQTVKFLSMNDPDKRSKLIDYLLGTDGYASHNFNFWADVLRYTDTLNGNVPGDHYRQWIKQSLAENKPWNRMVYELLTAQGLIWENPATGYLQRDANMPLDNMNNTIRIFLGTRIGCAQCHNHPFDRWTQKEFYQMAAFTFGTQTQAGTTDTRYWKVNPHDRLKGDYNAIEQEEEERRTNFNRFERMLTLNQMIVNDKLDRKITLPKDYAYTDAKPNDVVEPKVLFGKPVELRKGETPRQGFARWVVQKDNPRFALTVANRLWKQCFGIGQIEPVDDMMDSTVAENPELMALLESEMKAVNFELKEYLRILYHTETYQRQACFEEIQSGQPYHFPGPLLRRMTAEQVWDSFVTLASPVPFEYREMPAELVTKEIDIDLNSISAEEVLEAERRTAKAASGLSKRQQKHLYKGVLVARASELPSPVPASHFLRVFGQSDRELISASSTSGSVPQVLFMFNGPITHMLLEKDSTIYKNIAKRDEVYNGVKTLFLTILNRSPDAEEAAMAIEEVKRAGPAGYGNVVWSLVNTREFLFVQ
jgi:tetratricopeptide (TPR) repeat protein